MLLCLSSVDFGVLEEAVDLAGDVAFEAALGFSGGFAFGGSFGDVELPPESWRVGLGCVG